MPPIFKSALIQIFAWLITSTLAGTLISIMPAALLASTSFVGSSTRPIGATLSLALLQGLIALCLTLALTMRPWWRIINTAFPVAVTLMGLVALPDWLYLTAFLLTLGLYWTTFLSQVPLYPSKKSVIAAIENFLPDKPQRKVLDIGSGMGDFVLHYAAQHPGDDILGIEIAPLPWLISQLRGRLRGRLNPHTRLILGDYYKVDLAGYDIVFAYLSPAAMPALWQKASPEMRPGGVLISHEFEIPGVAPDHIIPRTPDAAATYIYFTGRASKPA